jgi:hypothetical protein
VGCMYPVFMPSTLAICLGNRGNGAGAKNCVGEMGSQGGGSPRQNTRNLYNQPMAVGGGLLGRMEGLLIPATLGISLGKRGRGSGTKNCVAEMGRQRGGITTSKQSQIVQPDNGTWRGVTRTHYQRFFALNLWDFPQKPGEGGRRKKLRC